MKGPNFILFVTDQQRADFLGCYSHPLLKTPHIDSIAARGTAFDRFHVASPVCMPNRASLMTGRMPSVHGVRCNGIPLSRRAVTFVDLLRSAGYSTALIGKSHLQNFTANAPLIRPLPAPPDYREPSADQVQAVRDDLDGEFYRQEQPEYWRAANATVKVPFYGFDRVELVTGHGDDLGGDYLRWLLERRPDARELIGASKALPSDVICPQAHRTAIPAELYSTAFIAERSIEFLRTDARDGRPFFLMVSFPDPHHPFNPPGRYWDMYRPEDFPVPEAFRRNDWAPPPHVAAAIAAREEGRANLQGMNTIAVSAREAQEAQALTCGMISCIDDAIGAILAELTELSSSQDTVLIFTSDHGDHLGDHRLLLKGPEHYQALLRVPFVWADPQAGHRPKRSTALASTIDISATILDRARVHSYAGMQGRSLLPIIVENATDGRDSLLVQYEHQQGLLDRKGPSRVYTLVHDRWRLSLFRGFEWGELYDLKRDPGEFENLWDSPAHAEVKLRLLELLAREEMQAVDEVPLPTRRA